MNNIDDITMEMHRQSLYLDIATLAVYGLSLIVAAVAAWFIYNQLKSQKWNTLLLFEQDMHKRRNDFHELANNINNLPKGTKTTTLEAILNSHKESYLNSVERLSSSILNGQFPNREMKQDYKEFITNVVRDFNDHYNAGTRYRKTLILYEKWQD